MKPTYEELESQLSILQSKLSRTEELLKLALERIHLLEERLNKNSKNSSKPPSTDQKANTSDSRRQRKSRPGTSRSLLTADKVDHFHKCTLDNCPNCGSKQLVEQSQNLILQQVELPEVKAVVTQFTCPKYYCKKCGDESFAKLPKGVPNSAFGPRLMALIATLTGVFHLSKRDVIQLVLDLYGIDISEGSLINVEERVADALEEVYQRIHRHVMSSLNARHFDETSWRDRGKNRWIWVASTSNATCFRIDANRSKEAFKRFAGTLSEAPIVTDRYSAYNGVTQPHQYCLAHLIRNFRKYAEREGSDKAIGAMIEKELRRICKIQNRYRQGEISRQSRGSYFRHQKKRLLDHLIEGLAEGSKELSSLCDRLYDEIEHLWVFSRHEGVDPTNNLAERDLRKLVLWRRKSYGTRSERGQRFVERISSIAGTVRKAGENILNFITDTVMAFYSGARGPSLSGI